MQPLATKKIINRRFCVAPMLDWTDRHCRYFHRLLSKNALLYTEMITTGALLHGDANRFLHYNRAENPIALQLGGSNPRDLALCAEMAQAYYYDEVNLNIGCPSDRVQQGRFGACLMAEPQLVAECVNTMQNAVTIPITVKCRIGIDEQDSYEQLLQFINTVAQAGCKTFIVHARKAWLSGLSPKQNRDIPPLRYEVVYQLKKDYPDLEIIINGGITSLEQSAQHLQFVDGVMLGREVYSNPYLLAEVDSYFFCKRHPIKSREQIIMELIPYIQQQLSEGRRLNTVTRHILGLFHCEYGAKQWRRLLSENVHKLNADEQLVLQALALTKQP
jgi:tRNA-dihydrouridine synthase A